MIDRIWISDRSRNADRLAAIRTRDSGKTSGLGPSHGIGYYASAKCLYSGGGMSARLGNRVARRPPASFISQLLSRFRNMPGPVDVQRATLDRFIAGWSNWSAAEMVETWTDDCTQSTLPSTLGHPPRSRSEVLVVLPLLQKLVTDYKVSTAMLDNAEKPLRRSSCARRNHYKCSEGNSGRRE